MSDIHKKIVGEIVQEYSNKKHVIGICLFGSVAINKEKDTSDVDITIIYDDDRDWELFKKGKYGIKIDFEIVTKKIWKMMSEKYPYLFYIENDKILLDKIGFITEIKEGMHKYLEKNPVVKEFWIKQYNQMREAKKKGIKPRNFVQVCDEAQMKFSENHNIERNVLTKDFFLKHKN